MGPFPIKLAAGKRISNFPIIETHRVHGSRLLFLKGKYAKTSFDELFVKILNESKIFLHITISLSNELFYFERL